MHKMSDYGIIVVHDNNHNNQTFSFSLLYNNKGNLLKKGLLTAVLFSFFVLDASFSGGRREPPLHGDIISNFADRRGTPVPTKMQNLAASCRGRVPSPPVFPGEAEAIMHICFCTQKNAARFFGTRRIHCFKFYQNKGSKPFNLYIASTK